jgi:hypothetical protein
MSTSTSTSFPSPETPIYIYFHICCINNWRTVVDNLFEAICKSGLYDKVTEIRCGVLGQNIGEDLSHPIFKQAKVKIMYHSTDVLAFERPTLARLYEHAYSSCDDFSVLYLHSKGVRHNGQNPCVEDWVNYLTHFNIMLFRDCLLNLNHCDVVSVNLQHEPCTHFSGNFWWSNSEYIKKLNPMIEPSYNGPEFWITQAQDGQFHSMYNSHVNHYHERFEPCKYKHGNV